MKVFIIIAVLSIAVVLFSRRSFRQEKEKHIRLRKAADEKAIPRIGTAGTITKEQASKLREYLFEPMKDWSCEEADLFIETAGYLRAVLAEVAGLEEPPLEIQNKLFIFILKDENLRDYMKDRCEKRRGEEGDDKPVDLPHNAQFEIIAAEARRLAGKE